jgi:RNA polymerase sigma-70 factor (ECF subfamily)
MSEERQPFGLDPAELRGRVSAAIATLFPRLEPDEREDHVQNAMVRLLEALERAGERGLNATYVWRTAHSVVLDELQRARRRTETSFEPEELERHAAGSQHDPEGAASLSQLRRALQACLSALADDRRRAVVLQWLGYAPAETARLLGWNAKRAANLCYRGLADLRLCLSGKGFGP